MLDIEIDVPSAELARRADAIPRAVQSGLERVAAHAQQIAIRQAGNINRRAIPTRGQVNAYRRAKGGSTRRRATTTNQSDPAWERKGGILRSLQAAPVFEREAVSITADVEHAEPRHELGVTRQPRDPALGIVRRDPFFTQTEEIIEPQIGPLFEDGFNEEWEG